LANLKQAAGITGILIAAEAGSFKSQQKLADLAPPTMVNSSRQPFQSVNAGTAEPEINFSINRLEISGNDLVSNDMLLISLSDFYGSDKTRSDLTFIRNRIVEIYRLAGVDNIQVSSPQLVNEDTVRITIQEK